MKCPYCVDYITVQQTAFDFDKDGMENGQSFVEAKRCILHDCLWEECGAWHDGRCAYVGAVS